MQVVVLRTSLEEGFSIRRGFRSCQIAYIWSRDAYTVYSRANVGTGNSPCAFDAANRAASIRLISGQADRYVLSSEGKPSRVAAQRGPLLRETAFGDGHGY